MCIRDSYSGHPLINIVIMLLIIIGGIGFMTLDDIKCNKFHIKKYRMQTKVILVTSGLLILIPAVCFFFFEFSSDRWNISLSQRIFYSLFQAVTPRTAGFNTVNFNMMKQGSIAVSYTHLDVYKRQVILFTCIFIIPTSCKQQ